MAYTNDGIKIRMNYDYDNAEWRWYVEAHGTAAGEYSVDSGTSSTHSAALTAISTAITNRLA